MGKRVDFDDSYKPSEKIVAREIQGELIIIPIYAGVGDSENDLFSLNDFGKEIWKKLDGKSSVKQVVEKLHAEFDAPTEEIKDDVLVLLKELLKRRIIEKV